MSSYSHAFYLSKDKHFFFPAVTNQIKHTPQVGTVSMTVHFCFLKSCGCRDGKLTNPAVVDLRHASQLPTLSSSSYQSAIELSTNSQFLSSLFTLSLFPFWLHQSLLSLADSPLPCFQFSVWFHLLECSPNPYPCPQLKSFIFHQSTASVIKITKQNQLSKLRYQTTRVQSNWINRVALGSLLVHMSHRELIRIYAETCETELLPRGTPSFMLLGLALPLRSHWAAAAESHRLPGASQEQSCVSWHFSQIPSWLTLEAVLGFRCIPELHGEIL